MAIYGAIIEAIAAIGTSAASTSNNKTQIPGAAAGTQPNPTAQLQTPKTPNLAAQPGVGDIIQGIPDEQTVKRPDAQDGPQKPAVNTPKLQDILGGIGDALSIPGVAELLGLSPQKQNTVVLPVPGGPAGGQVAPGFALPRHSIGDIINSIPRAYGR